MSVSGCQVVGGVLILLRKKTYKDLSDQVHIIPSYHSGILNSLPELPSSCSSRTISLLEKLY